MNLVRSSDPGRNGHTGTSNNPLVQTSAISHGAPLPRIPLRTLPEALQRAAETASQELVFIAEDGTEDRCTYGDLLHDARRLLAGLLDSGLEPGEPVVFQLQQNRCFLTFFWACQLGGLVPVPIAVPPKYEPGNMNAAKLVNVCGLLDRPTIALSAGQVDGISALIRDNVQEGDVRLGVFEDLWEADGIADPVARDPEDLALLLLTSGSTGTPKAVQHTHRTLLARTVATIEHNRLQPSEVTVNWFPMDHVAGLIMFHFRDVFLGCAQIHAPTNRVLRAPIRWLDLMSKHRATVSWAPNFAFGLINDQAERVRSGTWDLSTVKMIMNAGEVIVAGTARRFLELLGPHGLAPTVMCPAWGMSETVSAVTYHAGFSLETTSDDDPHVSVGGPIPGFSMRIVDAQDRVLNEKETGRLQVRGEFVTPGYYRNPEQNAENFTSDGWFVTGDLGVIEDGCLTITGREKDVMVINGIIYHGHELESAIEQMPGLDVSYTVAVGARRDQDDTDNIVIFFRPIVENDVELVDLIKRIRGRIARSFGISPQYLIPVERGEVPKTEIGKLQRTKIRQSFQDGGFDERVRHVHDLLRRDREMQSVRGSGTEAKVFDAWVATLSHENFGIDDNFFEVGGGSLKATRLCAELEAAFGRGVPLITVFDHPTVRLLAGWFDGGGQSNRFVEVKARATRGERRRRRRLHVSAEAEPERSELSV